MYVAMHVCFIITGSKYHIGFLPNFDNNPYIAIMTSSEEFTTYSIQTRTTGFSASGNITSDSIVNIALPNQTFSAPSYSVRNSLYNWTKEGGYLQINSNEATVIGTYNSLHSDTYFSIPTVDLCIFEYTYFGMSVRSNVRADSSMVIVGTKDRTRVSVSTRVVGVPYRLPGSINWNRNPISLGFAHTLNRGEAIYISLLNGDLTSTRVYSYYNPVSVFSGHECGELPRGSATCNNLIEQLPPTDLWGTVYYFAPIAGRTSYTIKIVSSSNLADVDIYCNNTLNRRVNLRYGWNEERTYNNQEFCVVRATRNVLVVQFSRSYQTDNAGGTFMSMIPPTNHYTNTITSATFENYEGINTSYNHYINLIVLPDYYQPEMISITTPRGENQTLESLSWVPVRRNNIIEAYAVQVNISYIRHDVFEVTHLNKSALMNAVVYGFGIYTDSTTVTPAGYGHPGRLMGQVHGMFVVT